MAVVLNSEERHSRLDSLAVAGHVHVQVVRVVQHLYSKQVVLQVAAQLGELEQFPFIEYSPAARVRILLLKP